MIKIGSQIGSNCKVPRWAKAININKNLQKLITKINFEVGRTGKITPLVWFEPRFIDGSTIQKHDE